MVDYDIRSNKAYCNVMAIEKGLDAAGYAGEFEMAFALELPLPWPRAILLEPDRLPMKLRELIAYYLGLPEETRPAVRPLFIAPDDDYSRPGYRRLLHYQRLSGLSSQYDRRDYLVPEDAVGDLIWALHQAPDDLPQFESYRQDVADVRDILVCTHGSRDAACAKFGYPLYRYLRDEVANDAVRVWRVNHFGGHVFAPTLMDMPKGDYWAFVDPPEGSQIVARDGDISQLRKNYRGNALLPYGFAQAMEREIMLREGWAWQGYLKQAVEMDKDAGENPEWADIEITYQSADGAIQGIYTGHVIVGGYVQTIGSTGDTSEHAYPQYHVTRLEKTA